MRNLAKCTIMTICQVVRLVALVERNGYNERKNEHPMVPRAHDKGPEND